VRHLQVYTDSYGALSSGTVTMYSTSEAIEAMTALDGKVLAAGTAPLKVCVLEWCAVCQGVGAGDTPAREAAAAAPRHAVACSPHHATPPCPRFSRCELQVTWAQLSTLPRRNPAGAGPPPPMPRGFTVSYACIPARVTPAEVAAAFERFGGVLQVVPFAHRREGAPNSRGCGLVVLDSEAAAMAAVDALSGKWTWPGAERPLLVQPFYGTERGGGATSGTLPGIDMLPGAVPYGRASSGGGMMAPRGMGGPTNHNMAAAAGPRGHRAAATYAPAQPQQGGYGGGGYGSATPHHSSPSYRQAGAGGTDDGVPPPGCAPDAFKLVLTNVPASYSQADVLSLLQPYGSVVCLTLVPASELSRDSTAIIWYATGQQADAALAALSNTVLMAAEGSRQLALTAFKSIRPGTGGQPQYVQQQPSPQAGMWGASPQAGIWASPQAVAAPYQQQQQVPMLLQQQQQLGYASQPQALAHDGGMWAVSAAPGGMPGAMAGGQGQLLAAVTAGMGSNTAAGVYSMQQLLSVLPGQQQPTLVAPSRQMWPGGGMMTGGLDASLPGTTGDAQQLLLPAVSSASIGMMVPPGGGAGYTGWPG
jgi:hypothetical protein